MIEHFLALKKNVVYETLEIISSDVLFKPPEGKEERSAPLAFLHSSRQEAFGLFLCLFLAAVFFSVKEIKSSHKS